MSCAKINATRTPRGSSNPLSGHGHHGNHSPLLAQEPHYYPPKGGRLNEAGQLPPNYTTLYKLRTICIVTLATDYIESRKILSPE
jgi:hypothetical protein